MKRCRTGARRTGLPAGAGPRAARGFSLVVVVFVILVLAALAGFAIRIGASQQHAASSDLLIVRAQAAAASGIEYGANRALKAASCPASTTLNPTAVGMAGFAVTVTCQPSVHQIGLNVYQAYALSARARRGNYGSSDFVSRTVTRTVTNAP